MCSYSISIRQIRTLKMKDKTLIAFGETLTLIAFIGYKRDCLVLNYKAKDRYVTEYTFPMHYFNIENFHSAEFQKYESAY